jgi:LacI family transcriptional regulator
VANRLARSLRNRTRNFIGFLVPDIENLAYSIAADACARYLANSGYQLILAISGDDPELEYSALRSLVEAQVAGLIVAPTSGLAPNTRTLLNESTVVEFNRTAGLSEHAVLCDDHDALARATRHLLDLGHESIAYVGTTDALSNGHERLEGVRQELARAGIVLDPRWTRLLPPTEKDGYESARALLSMTPRPTALLVGSSNLSMGTARAIREMGIRMPAEMSLVVYGDSRWGELYEPGLTTVTAPYQAMARRVTDIVSRMLTGEGDSAAGQIRLPAELVVRGSTAGPTHRTPGG